MHEGALNAETRSVIDLLVSKGVVDGFYLAGGTAASLHFGHRVSYDLDWFAEGGSDRTPSKPLSPAWGNSSYL